MALRRVTALVTELLAEAASARPDAIAARVVGGLELTYREWHKRSAAQAGSLRDAGIDTGDRVALLFDTERWTEYAVTYVAVVAAGAIPIPLSAELSSLEVARALRACGAKAVVSPSGLRSTAFPVRRLDPALLEQRPGQPSWRLPVVRATAEIVVRSRPLHAPVLEARSVDALLAGAARVVDAAGARGVLLHSWPIGAVPGQDALCAAVHPDGVCSVVMPAYEQAAFWSELVAGGITACSLHPAVAGFLLVQARAATAAAQLRGVILAGGRVTPAMLLRLAQMMPSTRVLVDEAGGRAFASDPASPVRAHSLDPGDISAALASVWRRVLKQDHASPEWDFFESGGDGVQAARLLRLVDDAIGVRIEMAEFLKRPTLLGVIETATRALTAEPSGSGQTMTAAPAALSQEGMVWHECFAPGCQNLPGLARRFRGVLRADVLCRAVDEIVRRHEPLRTTFAVDDGRLVQVVHPSHRVGLRRMDLSSLSREQREAEINRLVADAGSAPFDLVDGPLFEPTLVRLDDDDHVLIIRTHHSVFDDWSVGIFRRQLGALYEAYASGSEPAPPQSSVTFAQFAREQHLLLAGDAGADEIRFWTETLRDGPLTTQLAVQDLDAPSGSPQPPGGPITRTFPEELRSAVHSLARRERTTVFSVLLAAFAVVASRRTGQDDLLLSTVVANRNRTELERLIGCFTKKVPLRIDLRGDPDFAEVLSRTRASLLGALQHQDLPFEAVVQEVLGPRAAVHGLVPNVVVMVQGVTPRQELVLPALDTAGFETSNRAQRAHFMAAAPERSAAAVWGGGIYLGTFVILSVSDADGELSCTARGAFDGPAVVNLLEELAAIVSEATANPSRLLSELLGKVPSLAPAQCDGAHIDGFRVDTERVAAALSACPGVHSATVRLDDTVGHPRMVAEIVPNGFAPTEDSLRTWLWTTLPGYAWPGSITVVGAPAGGNAASTVADAGLLGAIWADVLGIDECRPEDNYWQDFSFLEALARARDAGVRVPTALITRNRTLGTLATAMAARPGREVAATGRANR